MKPKAINGAKICPGFKVVATPYQADRTDSSKQAVDMGLYRTAKTPKCEKDKAYPAVDWFDLDLPMECKADETEQDAFDENQLNGEPTGDKRRDALGQAYSYIELIVKQQHRMFAPYVVVMMYQVLVTTLSCFTSGYSKRSDVSRRLLGFRDSHQ